MNNRDLEIYSLVDRFMWVWILFCLKCCTVKFIMCFPVNCKDDVVDVFNCLLLISVVVWVRFTGPMLHYSQFNDDSESLYLEWHRLCLNALISVLWMKCWGKESFPRRVVHIERPAVACMCWGSGYIELTAADQAC